VTPTYPLESVLGHPRDAIADAAGRVVDGSGAPSAGVGETTVRNGSYDLRGRNGSVFRKGTSGIPGGFAATFRNRTSGAIKTARVRKRGSACASVTRISGAEPTPAPDRAAQATPDCAMRTGSCAARAADGPLRVDTSARAMFPRLQRHDRAPRRQGDEYLRRRYEGAGVRVPLPASETANRRAFRPLPRIQLLRFATSSSPQPHP
jgi:hypothetical protein